MRYLLLLVVGLAFGADTTIFSTKICKFRSKEFAGFKVSGCDRYYGLVDTIPESVRSYGGLFISGTINSLWREESLPDTMVCKKQDSTWKIRDWYAPCKDEK